MPRFAANLSFLFGETPFLDRFDAAARAGFDAVEFGFAYEHAPDAIRQAARDARVDVVLINAPPGDLDAGEFGLAALPGRERETQAGMAQALSCARALGCGRIHLLAGVAPPGALEALQTYKANLTEACAVAARSQVDILIEPINPRSKPGYFLNSFAVAEAVIAELSRPNLKLLFDIFHRQILHGDVIQALRQNIAITGHVQVAAVPDRREPGTGELADARLFALLDELGYQGVVGAEYHPSGPGAGDLAWFSPHARRR